MKIGFFSPYIETLGGGERYMLTLASHWSISHDVRIFLGDASLLLKASDRFNLDVSRIKVESNVFKSSSVFKKLIITKQYDCIFFLTDGSIPSSLAKYNILHFQVPFSKLEKNPIKLSRFGAIVCNSKFTKNHLDPVLGERAIVIYPPVDVTVAKITKKEKIILSVGGFRGGFEPKKQSILLEVFKNGYTSKILHSWSLYFVGGLHEEDLDYFNDLKKKAYGFPIKFYENAELSTLKDFYARASIYWHAAGFGETDPEQMEHFGMSTVEAMSAGAIVMTYEAGGQKEIIQNKINGLFWKTPTELLRCTQEVIRNKAFSEKIAKNAQSHSQAFSIDTFTNHFDQLLAKITHA